MMPMTQVHSAHSSAAGAGIALVASLVGASPFAVGACAGAACAGAACGEDARGGPLGAGAAAGFSAVAAGLSAAGAGFSAAGALGRCRGGGADSVDRPVVVVRIESGGVAGSTTTRDPTWTLP